MAHSVLALKSGYDEMAVGQKEKPWGPQVFGIFFLLPIWFFRYPFLKFFQIVP